VFVRISTITGARNFDDGVAFVRDTVVPAVRQQNGYAGLVASSDRDNGVMAVLTLWRDQAARDSSESGVAKVRDEAQRVIGGTMAVELFDEVLFEAAKPLREGASLLVRRISMDPSVLDENLAYFRAEVVPQIKAEPGFLAVRQMVNRQTGEGLVGVAFEDADSLRAGAAHAEARRGEAEKRGVRLEPFSERVIDFVDQP
jgi:heme-degrading monooxygenase HmoA